MHAERMPQPRLRRGMTLKSKTQPHLRCGMMLYISPPLQVLFMPWVTSDKYKWITLTERRRSQREPAPKVRIIRNTAIAANLTLSKEN
jgi:hypothetical protein